MPITEESPVKHPKTDRERQAIEALCSCVYLPGSWEKKFAHSLMYRSRLSEKQVAVMWKQVWRYRRQIEDRSLVQEAQRMIAVPQGLDKAEMGSPAEKDEDK